MISTIIILFGSFCLISLFARFIYLRNRYDSPKWDEAPDPERALSFLERKYPEAEISFLKETRCPINPGQTIRTAIVTLFWDAFNVPEYTVKVKSKEPLSDLPRIAYGCHIKEVVNNG